MFICSTRFSCDICNTTYSTSGGRMSDCASKDWFRHIYREYGWKTVYKKYDVCGTCIKRYGLKYIRKILKEKKGKG